jgi:hypothetical protein
MNDQEVREFESSAYPGNLIGERDWGANAPSAPRLRKSCNLQGLRIIIISPTFTFGEVVGIISKYKPKKNLLWKTKSPEAS